MAKIHSDVPSNGQPVDNDSLGHYRQIVELSRDLIVIHLRGKVVFVNEAGAEMVGASSPEQCIGMSVLEFLSPSRREIALERMQAAAAVRDGKSPVYEQRLRRLDGTEFDVALRGMPIRYRGEDALLFVARDITEQKRAEAALRESHTELERRVAERTAELETANEELEAFAYSVSHDLRAPLRHVDGFVSLLRRKAAASLDEEGRRYLDTISSAARRMAALIDDLLSFSRMGHVEMSRVPVELASLVDEVVQEAAEEIADREVRWRVSELPVVTGDRAMLRVVLVNLISNALKFTRSRARAEIEVGWHTGAAGEAVVFVRDNGVGFDMAHAEKLYGVFQRLHTADEFEGTGIGLATVRRIIDRHGGRAWGEAAPDRGATLYFSLPRAS